MVVFARKKWHTKASSLLEVHQRRSWLSAALFASVCLFSLIFPREVDACLPFFCYLLSCHFADILLSLCFSIRFSIATDRSHVGQGLDVSLWLIAEIDMTRHTQQCIEKKEKDDDDNSGGGGGDDEDDNDDCTLYHHKTHACTSRQSRQTRNAREMKKG